MIRRAVDDVVVVVMPPDHLQKLITFLKTFLPNMPTDPISSGQSRFEPTNPDVPTWRHFAEVSRYFGIDQSLPLIISFPQKTGTLVSYFNLTRIVSRYCCIVLCCCCYIVNAVVATFYAVVTSYSTVVASFLTDVTSFSAIVASFSIVVASFRVLRHRFQLF